jgi:hypothetical protein
MQVVLPGESDPPWICWAKPAAEDAPALAYAQAAATARVRSAAGRSISSRPVAAHNVARLASTATGHGRAVMLDGLERPDRRTELLG